MISTDFAPNESWDDALLSLKLLLQLWRWRSGSETIQIKKRLLNLLAIEQYNNLPRRQAGITISLFLSGRSALYYLLKTLNLPKGSQVLVQAFTCEAVVLPIIELGLKPVYIDIESETFSMDFAFLTRQLGNQLTSNSRVLILQHTFGLTPKFRNEILKFVKEHKLIIIEDLAHGFNPNLFASPNSYHLTSNYLLLSFGRSKAFSSVFGGSIVSTDNRLSEQLKNLQMPSYAFIFLCLLYKPLTMLIKLTYDIYLGKLLHFILNKLGLLIPEITKKEKNGSYDQIFNKAYPNALAILLNHQLNKFERVQEQRAKICNLYSRVILRRLAEGSSEAASNKSNYANARFFPFDKLRVRMTKNGLIRFPLLVENRDMILEEFRKQNIFLGKWYDQVVAPNDLDLDRVGYKLGSCPNAEEICKKIINLPTNISENEAEKVVKTLGPSEVEGL